MDRSTIRSSSNALASSAAVQRRGVQIGVWMLAAALLLCGCQGDGGGVPTATPRGGSQAFPFAFTLTTDKTSYIRSEVVHATFTVTNNGTETAYYSSPAIDATVSQNGQVFWQISKGGEFSPGGTSDQGVISATLSPGQSAPFKVDWDQRDQQGNYVAPGQYTLLVWLSSGAQEGSVHAPQPYQTTLAAPPVTITIQDMPVPAIPAAPTLTATKGNGADLLSWTAVSGAAGYHVYRAPGFDLASVVLSTASADQTSFSDTNDLLPGTKYYYTVRAFNIAGIEGPDSNQAIVQT
ncbi:MAG TPA: BsuPI-related putative proteinase inhibitor [Armatimonadota bacterium]|nr:BsuPI-related putative proteinase inhibitor [Armatimonadota bacterium]